MALIVAGIIWLVVFYLTVAVPSSPGAFNLAVGFGAMVSSLIVLSRWR